MLRDVKLYALIAGLVFHASCGHVSHDESEALKDTRDFGEAFYTEPHLLECVAALDSLRIEALQNIYNSYSEMREAEIPEVETSSRILMLYTVTCIADTCSHYFSVSRYPYLATAYALSLIGMARDRFALPDPREIKVSKLRVFHAEWRLGSAEHAALLARTGPHDREIILDMIAIANLRMKLIEVKSIDFDYDEIFDKADKSPN